MTPTNQSVSGDAQNFGRPLQPLVQRTGPCWPGEIPDQRGCGTVEFKHGPIRPCKSLRHRTKGLLGTPLGRPWGSVHIRAPTRGTWPSIPPLTGARHGPNGSWPSEIPDQRGCGTVGVDHGPILPCKSLRDRTKGLLGTPLGRPWGSVHIRARTRCTWPSIPQSTARGTARTALGRGKSPTNEAVARSGSTTAQSARAKVYAIAPKGFWAPL